MGIRTHRDLIAWQLAMKLAKKLYAWTRGMPPEERFGLTLQMRRASVSIPSNIAEGYGRQTLPDYLKFLRQARASLLELSTQAELAVLLEMLQPDPELTAMLEEEDRVLQGLIRSLQNKDE
jgi:four helix bundle protein